jgi:threonine dehydrogenase-like Zn-dependent dehydrogenase
MASQPLQSDAAAARPGTAGKPIAAGAMRVTPPNPRAARAPDAHMNALCYHGRKSVALDRVPAVALTEPGDALVEITTTTVCGSDLHLYHREMPLGAELRDGDILGHEAVGIVRAVGPNVTRFKPGDRVAISAVIACGSCRFCTRSEFSLCDNTNTSETMRAAYNDTTAGLFGYSGMLTGPSGGYDGLQAELARQAAKDNDSAAVE